MHKTLRIQSERVTGLHLQIRVVRRRPNDVVKGAFYPRNGILENEQFSFNEWLWICQRSHLVLESYMRPELCYGLWR